MAEPLCQEVATGAAASDTSGSEMSLQQRFEAMRARRCAAAARVKAAERARLHVRTAAEKAALRRKFVERVRAYVGTPYSAARNPEAEGAQIHLDCCGLVRRVLLDLKEEFGFEVGGWNQAYLFDTLPHAVDEAALQPGDLVFWTADYDDPDKKASRHRLVHVEVYTGGGDGNEGTIGSRYEGAELDTPGVHGFSTYRSFNGHGAHGHERLFRSIDTWLDGICVSHCKSCTWGETKQTSSTLFAADAQ